MRLLGEMLTELRAGRMTVHRDGTLGTKAMKMTAERQDGVLSIRVDGRIDGSNAIEFQETIRTAVQDRDRAMIMDCEKISYISSAGLRAVLMTAKALSNRDVRFALYALSDDVLEVFEKSGFDKIITIYLSKAEAVGSLDRQ